VRPNHNLILSVAAIILFWHFISASGVFNKTVFPSPFGVALALLNSAKSFELFDNALASLIRVVIGLVIGVFLGIVVAFITANFKLFYDGFGRIINFIRSIPTIAMVPLSIVWFGIGEPSKIFIISLAVFFPVWVSSYSGFLRVDSDLLRAAEIYSRNKLDLLKVKFYAAMPLILTGIRISIAYAFIVVVVAEMAGSIKGIGLMIETYRLFLQTDKMVAYMLMLGILGYVSDRLFISLSKKFFPYARIEG